MRGEVEEGLAIVLILLVSSPGSTKGNAMIAKLEIRMRGILYLLKNTIPWRLPMQTTLLMVQGGSNFTPVRNAGR